MTSPFKWQGESQLGKALKKKNVKPGNLPPIILAGTPKWKAPNMQEKK